MVGLSARVCHLRQKLSPLAGAKQSPPLLSRGTLLRSGFTRAYPQELQSSSVALRCCADVARHHLQLVLTTALLPPVVVVVVVAELKFAGMSAVTAHAVYAAHAEQRRLSFWLGVFSPAVSLRLLLATDAGAGTYSCACSKCRISTTAVASPWRVLSMTTVKSKVARANLRMRAI